MRHRLKLSQKIRKVKADGRIGGGGVALLHYFMEIFEPGNGPLVIIDSAMSFNRCCRCRCRCNLGSGTFSLVDCGERGIVEMPGERVTVWTHICQSFSMTVLLTPALRGDSLTNSFTFYALKRTKMHKFLRVVCLKTTKWINSLRKYLEFGIFQKFMMWTVLAYVHCKLRKSPRKRDAFVRVLWELLNHWNLYISVFPGDRTTLPVIDCIFWYEVSWTLPIGDTDSWNGYRFPAHFHGG